MGLNRLLCSSWTFFYLTLIEQPFRIYDPYHASKERRVICRILKVVEMTGVMVFTHVLRF
jgi:hypothetical protein